MEKNSLKRILSLVLSLGVGIAVTVVILYFIAGGWPPQFLIIQSGSMEPSLATGELVSYSSINIDDVETREELFEYSIVPQKSAETKNTQNFGEPGDIIIFKEAGTRIIHRSIAWVQEGENWIEGLEKEHTNGFVCSEIEKCPAEEDGFITKGDNNQYYDQLQRNFSIVSPEQVIGVPQRSIIELPLR